MTVHGTDVVQTLRPSVEQAVLGRRACDRSRSLGAQSKGLLVQLVGETVHLPLDDVGRFAYRPAKQRRMLEDGSAHVAIAVAPEPVAQQLLQRFPALGFVGQDVVHSAHRADGLAHVDIAARTTPRL